MKNAKARFRIRRILAIHLMLLVPGQRSLPLSYSILLSRVGMTRSQEIWVYASPLA